MWLNIVAGLLVIALVMGGVMLWGTGARLPEKLNFLRGKRGGANPGSAPAPPAERKEPVFNQAQTAERQLTPMVEAELPDLPPLADEWQAYFCCAVRFYEEQAGEAHRFEVLKQQLGRRDVKIFRLLGFDEHNQEWVTADSLSSYRYWILMIPLADRSGSLSAQRLKVVQDDCRRFAGKLRQRCVFPDLKGMLERVEMLDEFCNEVDSGSLLRLRVLLAEPHTPAVASELLERAYMSVVSAGGREHYVYRLNSEVMFTATAEKLPDNTVQEILFTLDVPKVSEPMRGFDRMIQVMQEIAELKQGKLTDRSNNALNDTAIAVMRGGVDQLADKMKEQGVNPGSTLAHLLFS